jgi:uncharacterized caspase-like protein
MSRQVLPRRWPLVALLPSLVAALVLLDASQAQAEKGKRYALLVGVRKYDHRDLDELMYTDNDAEGLSKVLTGFSEVVVLTSTRGQKKESAAPTAKNIRAELKRLFGRATKHDTILIALAGHGLEVEVRESRARFFCPADAKPRAGATLGELSKTMISFGELYEGLGKSGAGLKVLLVDAGRTDPLPPRRVYAESDRRVPRGTAALFSCHLDERAFETPKLGGGHGIFFYHVIEGLKGKAKNDRGEVTWGSLANYVGEKVSEDVPRLIGGGARQTPVLKVNLTGRPPPWSPPPGDGPDARRSAERRPTIAQRSDPSHAHLPTR